MRFRRLMLVLLGALAVVPFGGLAPATAAGAAAGETCSYTVDATGFHLEWSVGLQERQFVVVERRTFSSWNWRGRPTGSTFDDGVAPRNSASVDYRLVIKTPGSVSRTLACTLASLDTFWCDAIRSGGRFYVRPDGFPLWNGADDVVFRRRTTSTGAWHWRARLATADAYRFVDGPSPTGTAEYQVWAREGGVIVAATNCSGNVVPSCLSIVNLETDLAPAVPRLVEATPAQLAALGLPGPAYVAPDGSIVTVEYDAANDLDVVQRIDPATGGIAVLGSFETIFDTELYFIDAAGGVYLDQWGGNSRTTQVVSLGVLQPTRWTSSDEGQRGTLPASVLPDGRTLLVTSFVDEIDRSRWSSSAVAYDPLTGVSEPLPCLDGVLDASLREDGSIAGLWLPVPGVLVRTTAST